jgi:hypothetical protein
VQSTALAAPQTPKAGPRVVGVAGVTFRWKDYRLDGRDRFKTMTLATCELVMGGRRGSHVVAANTFDAMFLVGGYFARNREPAIKGKLGD